LGIKIYPMWICRTMPVRSSPALLGLACGDPARKIEWQFPVSGMRTNWSAPASGDSAGEPGTRVEQANTLVGSTRFSLLPMSQATDDPYIVRQITLTFITCIAALI
jgi:hypothetical protein